MDTRSRSDPVDVPALRALEAEATPGPWHHQTGSRMVRSGARYVLRCYVDANSEDETFLCALRNAAPALLSAYEEAARLRALLAEVLDSWTPEHLDRTCAMGNRLGSRIASALGGGEGA